MIETYAELREDIAVLNEQVSALDLEILLDVAVVYVTLKHPGNKLLMVPGPIC